MFKDDLFLVLEKQLPNEHLKPKKRLQHLNLNDHESQILQKLIIFQNRFNTFKILENSKNKVSHYKINQASTSYPFILEMFWPIHNIWIQWFD